MQRRRQSAVPPLAIILPHPPLPRARSSRSLLSATSPHTPRSCGSPCPSSFFLATGGNRKSTDSWNSSIQEGGDDQDWEWKPEQTLLLSRTLDALPAHLLTPFNGPVPPSNLLERIARGVSQAKGPVEWPHSTRATRAKLLELARVRAKEAAEEKRARSIAEEDDSYYLGETVLQPTTNTTPNPRKPLYRQSSMDFIASAKLDLKDNVNLTRLSKRLQRTDRIIPNPAYHPYSRPQTRSQTFSQSPSNRPDSFPPPHVLNPSTPSSSTLYSSSSSDNTRVSRPANLRRASTLSNTSDPFGQAPDPRVQRIRRSDSFCDPPLGKRHQVLKRAPSFSASSVQSKNAAKEVRQDYGRGSVSPCPSSDEEEKIRTKKAKKPRVASKIPTPVLASPAPCTPSPAPPKTVSRKTKAKPKSGSTPDPKSGTICENSGTPRKDTTVSSASPKHPSTKPRANLQRNPSIFGAPLPQAQVQPAEMKPVQIATAPPTPVVSATPQTMKTLRRMKPRPSNFARRISFGSLVPPPEDGGLDGGRGGLELGSAFQLH